MKYITITNGKNITAYVFSEDIDHSEVAKTLKKKDGSKARFGYATFFRKTNKQNGNPQFAVKCVSSNSDEKQENVKIDENAIITLLTEDF